MGGKSMSKILIIEDSNDINDMLQDLLDKDHEVTCAFSGTEGLFYFSQNKFDLVLLDIMLPGKSGDVILKEIRQTSDIPVIVLTALGDKKLISEYLINGANDYITKPFDLDEVCARVIVQLRNSLTNQQKAVENLPYKNIVLDFQTFSITNQETTIRLGKKEFAIFELLLNNPKQVFTKEKLYEHIWQDIYLPGDNTLNTHLSNLRKKLSELDPDDEYIETLWGLGVRLAGEK